MTFLKYLFGTAIKFVALCFGVMTINCSVLFRLKPDKITRFHRSQPCHSGA